MGQRDKILITEDGRFDLTAYQWDDHLFSNILIKDHPINTNQAMDIIRFLRDEIAKMERKIITIPLLETLIESKLIEYGLSKTSPIRLDKSIFVKNHLDLSDNTKTVLEKRYLKKDGKGKVIETPEQMFRRVARHIAKADKKYDPNADVNEIEERFYRLMTEFDFLPNSPTLMNAGRRLGQLAACFVLPVEDSMEDIFETLKNAAIIHKSGGGTGFSFSRLRPANSRVGKTGGVASGPVSFMKVFNTATEQVKQGGTRRGANMAVMRIDHPDIMDFIFSKQSNNALNNFNISVSVTDQFMNAVKNQSSYDLSDPRDKKKVGELNASETYNAVIKQAWKNGDPGIIFIDRINQDNPTPELGDMECTNPCGEQPLLPMEACNLGSINLSRHVMEDDFGAVVDYDRLKETIRTSVHFLDNTIDMSKYPLPEIDGMVKGNRKIGLGVMGFADMLYQLEIPYDSQKAVDTAEEVMRFIQRESREASQTLAEKRGPFKNIDKSIFKDKGECRYRNATTTTIAPTGTLSIIAGCSSGIEPLFALSFVRRVLDDNELLETNPVFEKAAKERGFYTESLIKEISKKGSIKKIKNIPKDIKNVFVTAHDVAPEWHVRMQAAFQKYTDNAVSKTVNLPKDATIEDVMGIYSLAYELGCKGVTIYRDGSKDKQVLSFKGAESQKSGFMRAVQERPETLEGFTTKIKTGLGYLYITVTEYESRPFEVFATIGKSGRSTTAKTEAIGRLISLSLRAGVHVAEIVEQLKGIGGEHAVFQDGGLVLSIPDAISRVLEKRYLQDGKNGKPAVRSDLLKGDVCPECGRTIAYEEGCMTCHACGYTKCG